VDNAALLTRGLGDGREQRRMEETVEHVEVPEKMHNREGAPDEVDVDETNREKFSHSDETSTVRNSDRGRRRRRLVANPLTGIRPEKGPSKGNTEEARAWATMVGHTTAEQRMVAKACRVMMVAEARRR